MAELLFAYDLMKYPTNRLVHVVKNATNIQVEKFGEETINITGVPDQMIGGDYLCGVKGMITAIKCSIDSWLEVENLITASGVGENNVFCTACLKEASFIIGVKS